MFDFTVIVGFDWDAGNARKSVDKHSVSQVEAEQVLGSERIAISDDIGHSATEPRYQALGQTLTGRRLHIAFTLRSNGTLIRVISARDMNRKERARYDGQT